jgi:hypothetical protein
MFYENDDMEFQEVHSVEMTRSFDSTRRFDGMSHKTDDLELFRFVMFCNDL